MKVLTVGGATQDILLQYAGADVMTIAKRQWTQTYMLFESGEKIEIERTTYLTGGGATNAAVSFKRQGFDTACISAVGQDAGAEHIISDLVAEGVDASYLKKFPDQSTGTSYIITAVQHDRTIFTYRGANTVLTFADISPAALEQANLLYVTSLSGQAAFLLPDLAKLAKSKGVPVAINPGTGQLTKHPKTLKEALANVDILILNSAEAKVLMATLTEQDEDFRSSFRAASSKQPCGLNLDDPSPYLLQSPVVWQGILLSMKSFFRVTLSMGPSIVAVTNGANGVYAASKNTIYFQPSLRTNVVNTVGAGDAFGSCFVGSLLHKKPLEAAMHRGILNSASVLGHLGAKTGLLSSQELDQQEQRTPMRLTTFTL